LANRSFLLGHLNQQELSTKIDGFLITPTGELEHLHNQLIAAIYGNVSRETPDQPVAGWVSANDKPTSGAGSKPVSGDAAEQRLKTEVMQLPSRDRRRLKDLSQNEVWVHMDLVFVSFINATSSSTPKMPLPICLGNIVAPKLPDLQSRFLRVLEVLIKPVCPP